MASTVDVMDSIGEDFYRFGRVAAANSLSDIYAMGGEPLVALNVVCTPASNENMEMLYDVLKGAQEVIVESGAVVGGGHTTVSEHFKFGLAVSGYVHPDRIVSIRGAKVGDRLVLTKPLGGTSILNGLLAEDPDNPLIQKAFDVMEALNREASHAMVSARAHACTDVTGFGFLGHLSQMMEESGTTAHIWSDEVPVLDGALDHSLIGSFDRALNQHGFAQGVVVEPGIPEELVNVLYEAVTSGGLIISIAPENEDELHAELERRGVSAITVGEVVDAKPNTHVVVKPHK